MKANNRLEFARCAPDSQKRCAFARGSAGALAVMQSDEPPFLGFVSCRKSFGAAATCR